MVVSFGGKLNSFTVGRNVMNI